MENNISQSLYAESKKKALQVDFLTNNEELRLYATKIYNIN